MKTSKFKSIPSKPSGKVFFLILVLLTLGMSVALLSIANSVFVVPILIGAMVLLFGLPRVTAYLRKTNGLR